jgi:EAL domain-containing protein (putative c-di-GMP-specific phosphodiesterase class I)
VRLAEETPKLLAMFHQLRELRVGLSVDDFGLDIRPFAMSTDIR